MTPLTYSRPAYRGLEYDPASIHKALMVAISAGWAATAPLGFWAPSIAFGVAAKDLFFKQRPKSAVVASALSIICFALPGAVVLKPRSAAFHEAAAQLLQSKAESVSLRYDQQPYLRWTPLKSAGVIELDVIERKGPCVTSNARRRL